MERSTANSDSDRSERARSLALTLLLAVLAASAALGAALAALLWQDGSPGVGLPISTASAGLGILIGLPAALLTRPGRARRLRQVCFALSATVGLGWLVLVFLALTSPH